ncbi:hypothetical protein [Nodosilinea sp. P-1105]|uniref:hypothetical protein n=1 Tax=Nodosilinea sp. P-1105 TaxID=2546229 RepID=UPI00146BDF1B|nr:hypothetical protein [Nodosilinea sp. P-1105]NMF82358.1 hypothetical protein [Nodosilinea sp. P-1105]
MSKILFLVSAVVACGLGFWLTQRLQRQLGRRSSPGRSPLPSPPPELARQVKERLAEGKTIEAIKQVRRVTGWDLRTSTAYVDQIRQQILES